MCGKTGALVASKTVEYQILQGVEKNTFAKEIFSLCMDPLCEMAYFSADYGYLYLIRQIKSSLDYKEETLIKYVCYCQEITYDDVKKSVNNFGVTTIKEFFRYKKPIIVEVCKEKNPFGCSCIADIKKIIDDELKSK